MNNLLRLAVIALLFVIIRAEAQVTEAAAFQPVPELGYRVIPNFFHPQDGMNVGEASGVSLNSQGHIFLFQRAKPMLTEYDEHGTFLRSIGEGLFTHPHGLRIDDDDNLWTTDDGSHLVLKLSPAGRVLLVLGRRDVGAESDWLFNQPTDVAFGKNGEVYVSDGYGNSRVVKFDREGNFLKAWGKYGTGPGEFNLPQSVAVDSHTPQRPCCSGAHPPCSRASLHLHPQQERWPLYLPFPDFGELNFLLRKCQRDQVDKRTVTRTVTGLLGEVRRAVCDSDN